MVLSWLLLLVLAVPRGTTGAKDCMFCEPTDALDCPGIAMVCGDNEECYTGQGTAPDIGRVISKGCVEAAGCGHQELVTFEGVTYDIMSQCCTGEMCNGAPTPAGSLRAGAAAGLALGLLLLLP